jgi:hypothetical protein
MEVAEGIMQRNGSNLLPQFRVSFIGICGFVLQVVSRNVDDCVLTVNGHKPSVDDRGLCKSAVPFIVCLITAAFTSDCRLSVR